MSTKQTVVRASVTTALVLAAVTVGVSTDRSGAPGVALPPSDLVAVNPDRIYLSVSGYVGGESTAAIHPRMSEALSVSGGITAPSTTMTTTSKGTMSPLVLTKPVDAYTIQFAKTLTTGAVLPTVTVFFTQLVGGRDVDRATLVLTNARVKATAPRFAAASGSSEQVTLLAERQQLTYLQVDDAGRVTTHRYCWNFVTTTAC